MNSLTLWHTKQAYDNPNSLHMCQASAACKGATCQVKGSQSCQLMAVLFGCSFMMRMMRMMYMWRLASYIREQWFVMHPERLRRSGLKYKECVDCGSSVLQSCHLPVVSPI